jgi:hypothetical protein
MMMLNFQILTEKLIDLSNMFLLIPIFCNLIGSYTNVQPLNVVERMIYHNIIALRIAHILNKTKLACDNNRGSCPLILSPADLLSASIPPPLTIIRETQASINTLKASTLHHKQITQRDLFYRFLYCRRERAPLRNIIIQQQPPLFVL